MPRPRDRQSATGLLPRMEARTRKDGQITYRRRPDGSLLVGRQAAELALSGPSPIEPTRQAAANGLRWSRVA